ncbi:hypothetical protein SERLA73DRAFT_192075 [Serpula lacrymans var. lacrymans S7.3]|uniref:Uncharacterized protein n=2 Tax=Serpula lacrymans var. lacrymans TaxID=341189 RepID=F8QIX4_SERL3|nr:uncharacterized protein SERLADRAFT_473768 [Serpula lacrymans var. lacrymans S7.9]EGN91744.1 hypothetical protein SERLA73DRAFT_192075 [Serpula lacrymans var. lacrymans S7.3]EGO22662.1 hypothetical protein SERLADRAFT_473768 [Serpula lacrymans var. lacrymans S7.9]
MSTVTSALACPKPERSGELEFYRVEERSDARDLDMNGKAEICPGGFKVKVEIEAGIARGHECQLENGQYGCDDDELEIERMLDDEEVQPELKPKRFMEQHRLCNYNLSVPAAPVNGKECKPKNALPLDVPTKEQEHPFALSSVLASHRRTRTEREYEVGREKPRREDAWTVRKRRSVHFAGLSSRTDSGTSTDINTSAPLLQLPQVNQTQETHTWDFLYDLARDENVQDRMDRYMVDDAGVLRLDMRDVLRVARDGADANRDHGLGRLGGGRMGECVNPTLFVLGAEVGGKKFGYGGKRKDKDQSKAKVRGRNVRPITVRT